MFFLATGQDRQGNIVEYFGKEKVNEINEGKLFHVFQKGLAVKVQGRAPINFPKDQVFDKFLNDGSYNPSAGDIFDIDGRGDAMKWEAISVDSTSSFSDRSLRSSFVYLSFTSEKEKIVLFEASGHSVALVNGFPHEGDHYDFGYSLIPIKLKKGLNTFVMKVGRFPRIRARLIEPSAPQLFTSRDMTLPDILNEESMQYLGGIRVVNSSEEWIKNSSVKAALEGKSDGLRLGLIDLPPLSVTKIAFRTPTIGGLSEEEALINLDLIDSKGKSLAATEVTLKVKSKNDYHKRTFLSEIDNSVQYFSVTPTTEPATENQALFLSVHGASVEATNQARAYKKKDWGTLIAPTNRRPFGFAWEDWGRIDAMEVLAEAKSIYKPDPQKVYLTGHSMGGHGTWYLGATYPDHFAAIAPCAGYPDLLEYRNSFTRRLRTMNAEQLKRFGMTPEMVAEMSNPPALLPMDAMVQRAGNPSRTLKIKRNYLHLGVYILHGEKDNVVPTFIAQDMRKTLGEYHNDFVYYEYPDGTHWYGDHSVDWPQLFDFFKARKIPETSSLKKLEFYTTSPGVSASSHFVTIQQQEKPFELSSFNFNNEEGFTIDFENTATAELDLSSFESVPETIVVNDQEIKTGSAKKLVLKHVDDKWEIGSAAPKSEKGPHRNGGFKDAFRNNVVFVYGTKGSAQENDWNKMKAMFDAETFYYRANGKVEVIRDTDFSAATYKDRNVVIYGNSDSNGAWKALLKDCPIQVETGKVVINGVTLSGKQWGSYFVYPRQDSDVATIGVVTGTGLAGMKATYPNHYMVNGTSFPDFTLFDSSALQIGLDAIKCAGFFGNDWSMETGDFQWK
ncbi:hypothetical protein GCM10007940_13660 [Portibacter lacus]|uniref:AB hydrolase-1 domain-containing protein n=2 Tax=Portibacter lacus TaxID=1099794 RepID=A0AA37WCR2_9BACT|nr:hypothetical protein GCM10007940_13660 [Portibacter lacus]